MIKKIFIATGVAAIAAAGGSLLHPFGTPGTPGSNQPIFRDAQIDPETLAIFQRACRNCHSQQTEWPWYSHIAPVSWLLARDVQQARLHMNLSRWQDYSTDDRLRLLSEIGSAVRNREMPVQRYLLLHPEARLTHRHRRGEASSSGFISGLAPSEAVFRGSNWGNPTSLHRELR